MARAGTGISSNNQNKQIKETAFVGKTGAEMARTGVEVMNRMTLREQLKMYWQFFFVKGEKVPQESLPQLQLEGAEFFNRKNNVLKAAWLGHSTVLLNIDGYTILTDPVFSPKVSPVGPTRFNRELPLDLKALKTIDMVIISHDHYDHLNKFSVQQLDAITALFLVPDRVGKRLEKWGIDSGKIIELEWWEEFSPHHELKVIATPAQHFSGRGLFDRNSTLWASWAIQTPNHRVFYSGDSGYFDGFKEIGERLGPFDVTFLECGAYNEKWSNVHMFPEQTVQAFLDLKGRVLQPVHWGTFNLALHPWHEPMERLAKAAASVGVTPSTPVMGQLVDYHKAVSPTPWWVSVMEHTRRGKTQLSTAAYNVR